MKQEIVYSKDEVAVITTDGQEVDIMVYSMMDWVEMYGR